MPYTPYSGPPLNPAFMQGRNGTRDAIDLIAILQKSQAGKTKAIAGVTPPPGTGYAPATASRILEGAYGAPEAAGAPLTGAGADADPGTWSSLMSIFDGI